MPSASAVVVNYNGGDKVMRCLEALRSQTTPFAEIIVVDNGSSDGSPARIERSFPEVRLVELGSNPGPGVARNRGLREASSELVLWIDADIYAAPDCLARLLEARAALQAAIVVPRILLLPEGDVVQADGGDAHYIGTLILRNGFRPLREVADHRRPVGACPSGCILCDRRAMLAIGGFDESYFFYFEDFELGLRARSFGHDIVSEPAAVVRHDWGSGSAGLAFRGTGAYPEERAYLLMRNRLRVLFTHYRWRSLVVLAPALLAYEAASFVFALTRGLVRAWWRSWWWQLTHLGELRRRRRWIGERRVRRDRELLTGGALPLAPGAVRPEAARSAVAALSAVLDGYWRVARHLVG
jgi:GT2 family glycosyltransferase